MKSTVKNIIAGIVSSCIFSQTYPVNGQTQTISLNWTEIEKKVQQNSGKQLPVLGGLLPPSRWYGFIMPSFAYSGKEASYIVIYPGNLQRRLFFAMGIWRKRSQIDLRELIAGVVAHESRHITQGIRGYGIKNLLVFPGIFATQFAFPVALVAAALGIIGGWWPVGILLYYVAALTVYFYDQREQDARRYAREHWREWLPFVTVTTKQ